MIWSVHGQPQVCGCGNPNRPSHRNGAHLQEEEAQGFPEMRGVWLVILVIILNVFVLQNINRIDCVSGFFIGDHS